MTNDERTAAYDEALSDYADARARTRSNVEALTALLVAEKVLSACVAFDPALVYYEERWAP